MLVVEGSLVPDEYRGGLSIRADDVHPFEDFRQRCCTGLELTLEEAWMRSQGLAVVDVVARLRELLEPHRAEAGARVTIHYRRLDAEARLRLGSTWQVALCDNLLRDLTRWLGEEAFRLRFQVPALEQDNGRQRGAWSSA
jgi:DNA polymerase-3 subunit alpha